MSSASAQYFYRVREQRVTKMEHGNFWNRLEKSLDGKARDRQRLSKMEIPSLTVKIKNPPSDGSHIQNQNFPDIQRFVINPRSFSQLVKSICKEKKNSESKIFFPVIFSLSSLFELV